MTVLDPARKRALLAELLRRKAQRAQPIPLSAAQLRLWLLGQVEPGASTYNVPCAFRLLGRLDRAALQRALGAIVRRHDVLRATVRMCGSEPTYIVDENLSFELPIVDLEPPATLDAVLAHESARPFDLQTAVPIRALLVRIAADEHVLLVTTHHIATDGWSMGIFKRELGAFYADYRDGMPTLLDEPACTYADFAQWQHDRIGSADLERQLRYWNEQLADAPAPLDLATLRGDMPAAAGGQRSRELSPATHDALLQFCRAHGSTEFSTLFAAFAVLLHRYTGSRDFIIGSAVANRTRSEFEGLIGFFVNTLPLRVRVEDDPVFTDWLANVHGLTLDALDNQDVPFQTLVEAAHSARVATRTPLLNVMFVLQNSPDEPLALAGLDVTPILLQHTTAKFDLTLEVTTNAGRLRVAFAYRSALFDEPMIDAMLEAFETLVTAIVHDPNRPVSQLPLLSPAAERRQLVDWNATARPLTGRRVERLFERQAEIRSNALAIVDGPAELTYSALNERANRLAHYLRSRAIADGACVGICFERGTNAIVAILAILKAGGTYVPLDPLYPRDRLAHMLVDTGVVLALSEGRASAPLAGLPVEVVQLDRDASAFDGFSAANMEDTGHERSTDPAYIMYTSGSTGTPKGVLVPHAGIERLVTDTDYFSIAPHDAVAHASTLAFDASTFEIWAALLNGARLVIVPKSIMLAPHALRDTIEGSKISIMLVTTALMREIARSAPSTFAGLRHLLVGGEAVDVGSVTRLLEHAPPAKLSNVYGPTEATTIATGYRIDNVPCGATIPIGRPIANTTVYVLDSGGHPLPAGATGELFIGGPGVALGYLNDAVLTAKKFVPDPFCSDSAARLYATGDRARFLANGDVEFLGRADGQLKMRGFRIEPGEIETALRACAGVSDAVVVARNDDNGEKQLVAYVVVDAPNEPQSDAIRQQVRGILPAFMVPHAIVPLSKFPLKPNGKIDRGALPAFVQSSAAEAKAPAPARSEAEAALTVLWEQLLAVRSIGVRDSFFELGGHSLLAVRMMAEIEIAFARRLPLSLLFEQPTIEHLARVLEGDSASADSPAAIAFHADGSAQPLFFLHGSFGGGFYCRRLADRLGADQPLYALRPHGDDGRPLPETIEAMATEYVTLIKSIQPRGPYLLGGFCSGGLVAFEMARQLRAAGDSVSNVILLEVPVPEYNLRLVADWVDHVGAWLHIDRRYRLRLIGEVARAPHHWKALVSSGFKTAFIAQGYARLLRRRGPQAPKPLEAATVDDRLTPWISRTEAYVPRRYDGRLTVLQTNSTSPTDNAERCGWSTIAPQVHQQTIPGTHLTCITEFIDDTAAAIAGVLARDR
jgi:amino acid adenylation domain-containing protein